MTLDAKNFLAQVFDVEPFEVPDDASLDTYQRWDSLGHMQLVMLLETHLGRPLESEEILSIIDLESLDQLLTMKTGSSHS
ncbi:MAG: acyl carrier protein [Rhodospirillaceae bacterium]|jgi:acyl carrier protein|nr:acyl carrier protein [Rhodospirillaceae bacterium]MBT4690875.1 acyl carrier protein [Rhodospirillaceae bacterium]MBT5081544.1 acyl carrier protein [Rhodospirillaceae bacterium]MBT5526986.1 acyl carrier protein [Rhodospirillaceae bacterium]MBT5881882.1 acyl carrier protein [Rhodospirillaceae bacterium]